MRKSLVSNFFKSLAFSGGARSIPFPVHCTKPGTPFETLREMTDLRRTEYYRQLSHKGAILFRGFNIGSVTNFELFVSHFAKKSLFDYAGGASPRNKLGSGVYSSTEYPPNVYLPLHNELSYSEVFPRYIYFYCETAPTHGGETLVGDSRKILNSICPKIAGLFKHKGIKYERNLMSDESSAYSWQSAFGTSRKGEVETICANLNARFNWSSDDGLSLTQCRPATAVHPDTMEEVWFNQAHGFHSSALGDVTGKRDGGNTLRLNAYFADGSEIAVGMLDHVRKVLHREAYPHKWRRNDVLIMDNVLAAHGRAPFSGERSIAVAMT
jgi:alpha-ketoglutarate-dependent taurine dioxygenase